MIEIKDIYTDEKLVGTEVSICGWVRNHRKQKQMGFINFFDGTVLEDIQVVYADALNNFNDIQGIRTGASIAVTGKLVVSEHSGKLEIEATEITCIGNAPENYPLQPKKHSLEFLREIGYLRPRTKLFQAIFRVRSVASMAVHQYFQDQGYVYTQTPILAAGDCEGAGEMFTVTTLDPTSGAKQDFKDDFFGKQVNLTVSGQLQGETFAMAFKKIYTFGPTFRSENSNTKTHMAEFWMIEPEIAFMELDEMMGLQEDFVKYIIKYVLDRCPSEIEFLGNYAGVDLIGQHNEFLKQGVARIAHKDAITILMEAQSAGKANFEFKPEYGEDLAKEHEKYLTDEHFGSAVFVHSWPKDIKAFYMRVNEDNETVAAVDMLVKGSGELMGGSQREERYEQLVERMKQMEIPAEDLEWYLNLRQFGTAKHSGFGMGFERMLMFLTAVENIRDVIPYPRTPMNCEF